MSQGASSKRSASYAFPIHCHGKDLVRKSPVISRSWVLKICIVQLETDRQSWLAIQSALPAQLSLLLRCPRG